MSEDTTWRWTVRGKHIFCGVNATAQAPGTDNEIRVENNLLAEEGTLAENDSVQENSDVKHTNAQNSGDVGDTNVEENVHDFT